MMMISRRTFISTLFATLIPEQVLAASRRIWAKKTIVAWNDAYDALINTGIEQNSALLLTAQWAFETARGKRMWRYNFAGLKGSSPEGLYCFLKTAEIHKGKRIQNHQRFRAYSTLQAGADDFVATLKEKFPVSFEASKSGNIHLYVRNLKKEKYFTTHIGRYERGVRRHIAEAEKKSDKPFFEVIVSSNE